MAWFSPFEIIISLIKPLIQKLKEPCKNCLRKTANILENIGKFLLKKNFMICPEIGDEIFKKFIRTLE